MTNVKVLLQIFPMVSFIKPHIKQRIDGRGKYSTCLSNKIYILTFFDKEVVVRLGVRVAPVVVKRIWTGLLDRKLDWLF